MNFYNNGDKVHTVGDIDRLERENAELKAQVEQLRGGLNQAIELLVTALVEPQQITDSEISELKDIEQATPAQCLAEVKAQALEDEARLWPDDLTECSHVKSSLIESANELRRQANPFDKINKARDEASSALQNWINEAGD